MQRCEVHGAADVKITVRHACYVVQLAVERGWRMLMQHAAVSATLLQLQAALPGLIIIIM
jgi:hypothetical protein